MKPLTHSISSERAGGSRRLLECVIRLGVVSCLLCATGTGLAEDVEKLADTLQERVEMAATEVLGFGMMGNYRELRYPMTQEE